MTTLGKRVAAVIWLLALTVEPSQSLAHGLGWRQDFKPTITLNFAFADGEPLAYGEVSVFSPADPEFEYQKARSDLNGFFSFRPDQSGTWKFSAVDGQGHKTSGEIIISEEQMGAAARDAQLKTAVESEAASGSSAAPEAKSIILGLSVILNAALLALWRRRSFGRPA